MSIIPRDSEREERKDEGCDDCIEAGEILGYQGELGASLISWRQTHDIENQ